MMDDGSFDNVATGSKSKRLARATADSRPARSAPVQLRYMLPSIVTTFAICAGLTSVKLSIEGHLVSALYLIILAIFLDGLDGKLARFLDAASPFGAELDTLADFFNFGIAPGILLYSTFYMNSEFQNFGWLSCLVLAICCALRLARFNLTLDDPVVSKKSKEFFTGVPAPALACLALMPAFLYELGWSGIGNHAYAIAIYIIAIAGLGISTLPTFSAKHVSIPRKYVPVFVVCAAVFVVCMVAYPWLSLCVANTLYLASLPVSYRMSKRPDAAKVISAASI
jgi:CDP-diacylglycerol--serine O-phosphatidyltransferase